MGRLAEEAELEVKSTDNKYRLLPVKNYAVFYVVNEEVLKFTEFVYMLK